MEKGVEKREKGMEERWERDDSSLQVTQGTLHPGLSLWPLCAACGRMGQPKAHPHWSPSPLLLFPRVNLRGPIFFLPAQALKESQNDLIDIWRQ